MIYELHPNSDAFQRMVTDSDWRFESLFMFGTPVEGYRTPTVRWRTLEEEVADEQELIDYGECGDLTQAHLRFENGNADCIYVIGFSTGLVFSQTAVEHLRTTLESTGELFPVRISGQDYFIYNCTRVIDAVDAKSSQIRFVGDGIPSEFTKLVIDESKTVGESLFKIGWPKPAMASHEKEGAAIPPPLPIFSTSDFVQTVRALELKGFRFRPVRTF